MFPFALSFLLPVFVQTIVLEKQERLRHMMTVMGLRPHVYWAISFLFNYLYYLCVVILFVAVEVAAGVDFFVKTAWQINALIFGLWGLAQVCTHPW